MRNRVVGDAFIWRSLLMCLVYAPLLFGCGGGASEPSRLNPDAFPVPNGGSSAAWKKGELEPASAHANLCASPRAGAGYSDQQGRLLDEKLWIRAHVHETYLWYDEIKDRDPSAYSLEEYFYGQLKTLEADASGHPKDRDEFRFMMPTAEYRALAESGTAVGFGIRWVFLQSAPPRDIRVAFVEPGSPADKAGVRRGDQLHEVSGKDVVDGEGLATINGVFSPDEKEPYDLRFLHPDDDELRSVTLKAEVISEAPVPVWKTLGADQGPIGYILFQNHTASSESALQEVMQEFETLGVSDLILDLRYNSGGYLAIASQLAYMIAGDAATADRVFEQMEFNDKHREINPITGQPIQTLPFLSASTGGFSLPAGERLPSLNLDRLFVLTGNNTCSASESIINGLNGIDIDVLQFGAATCGKPYGFYAQDNCGTTYGFSQFRGVNDAGFGHFQEGFRPGGSGPAGLEGCQAKDDLAHALGDPNEARLAAALAYRETQQCAPDAASLDSGSLDGSAFSPLGRERQAPLFDGHMPRQRVQRSKQL